MTIIFFVALCTAISVWPCTCPNRENFFFDIFFNAGSGTSQRMTRMATCTSTASGAMILRRRQHGRSSSKHACTGRFSCQIRCCFTCRSFLVSYILRRGKRRCHPNLFHRGNLLLQSLSLLLDARWLQRLLHTQYMRFCALEFGFLLHRGDVLLVGLPHRPIPLLEHVDCAATPFHRTHTLVHWLAALVNRLISAQHRALHAALHAVPMNFIFETCFGSFWADWGQKKIFFIALCTALFFFIALCTALFQKK